MQKSEIWNNIFQEDGTLGPMIFLEGKLEGGRKQDGVQVPWGIICAPTEL
jgi:hypothetical protein